MDPGLIHDAGFGIIGCITGNRDVQQGTIGIAVHAQAGMHQRDVGHTQAVQQDRHRVHQRGGLIGDDLQRGPETVWFSGGDDPDQGLPCPTVLREAAVCGDQGGQHRNIEPTRVVAIGGGTGVRTAVSSPVRLGDGAVSRHTVVAPDR